MAAAVLERVRDGLHEILIVKLGEVEAYAGRWAFPFGPAAPGETPEPAIRRILDEQLGLHANIQHGQPPFDHAYGDVVYRWRFLFGDVSTPEANNRHYEEVRWVPRQSLLEYEFEPVSQQVVDWLLEE
jgi:8-oxo-dGTP diphosphatase